jgi:hypothetical protein
MSLLDSVRQWAFGGCPWWVAQVLSVNTPIALPTSGQPPTIMMVVLTSRLIGFGVVVIVVSHPPK